MTTQGELKSANMFTLKGQKVEVHHSSSSIAGMPTFDYRDGKLQKSFTGKEINVEATALGSQLTVVLEVAPDGWVDTFTLILPEVHVTLSEGIPIDVFGVRTRTRTSIGGPALVKGALATYITTALKGTAKYVVF